MPTEVSNEDIVSVSGLKASVHSRPSIIPVNSTMYISKGSVNAVQTTRKSSFLVSWKKSDTVKQVRIINF